MTQDQIDTLVAAILAAARLMHDSSEPTRDGAIEEFEAMHAALRRRSHRGSSSTKR